EYLRKEAQLRSASLENELLKKSIQPHYLMNSLNSISVWLRKKPENAIELIGALAEEFRIISSVSDLKLIPLDEELALCRAHLKIMSYRKGVTYTLESKNTDASLQIPPLVLHTLIENGITHCTDSAKGCHFKLEVFKENERIHYRLFNNCSNPDKSTVYQEGTGYSYIKSRLKENFADNWQFTYGSTSAGWQVDIKIKEQTGGL
ncbi:MAG: histidine kinase, partial [Calditrichota bacterium]